MTAPKRKRWLWLLVPFVVAPIVTRLYMPRVADSLARALQTFARPPSDAGADAVAPPDTAPVPAPDPVPAPAPAPTRTARKPGPPGRASAEPSRGALVVPKATTARVLPRAGKTVSGRNVTLPDGTRGVALRGIGALGTGLSDGDVITQIEGRPTPDVDAATQAITGAVGGGARAIHGTVVRAGALIDVVVELPDAT